MSMEPTTARRMAQAVAQVADWLTDNGYGNAPDFISADPYTPGVITVAVYVGGQALRLMADLTKSEIRVYGDSTGTFTHPLSESVVMRVCSYSYASQATA